ncbi:MAG TPA: winged helix-turn-helix domain-containing protein, partial [Cytophagales bacterium]
YFRKRSVTTREHVKQNDNLIPLGAYQFDPRNMALRHKDEVVALTGKESDLLLLLHTSANSTLEREFILKTVWGNEADYVGRTLDVFISKLRKKLEADPSLKIVNIRGVGYKLIVDGRQELLDRRY